MKEKDFPCEIKNILEKNSVEIKVKAGTSKTEITGFDKISDNLKVNVSAKAENNKANDEIERFFSKITNKNAKITKGFSSPKKTIRFF